MSYFPDSGLLVRVPSGELEIDKANEGALAYVCALYGLPWAPEYDASDMRCVVYAWAEDMQAGMARERAHCEAFAAELAELVAERPV